MLRVPRRRRPRSTTSALVFVLDRSFLVGLKVLAYSMIQHRTLLDLPVIVLSNDPTLADDPLVKELADRFVHVTPDAVSRFQGISPELVRERLRLDWIPKYTFLKWLIFDDWGVDQLIWIDADVLCTGNVDHLTELRERDLYAAEVFQPTLHTTEEGEYLSVEERDENILRHLNGDGPLGASLNSGVMVVNKPLLDREFRDELIAVAEGEPFENEQQVVRAVLERRGTRGWLSPFDNFHYGYAMRLSDAARNHVLQRIRLLHFIGPKGKPWRRARQSYFMTDLWWAVHDDAVRSSDIYGPPAADP
jgi:lipopolysaccharide biosynthesis glycosyltransferase